MWGEIAGAAISGLSGLFGGGGVGRAETRDMTRIGYEEAQRNAKYMPSAIIQGAKRAGIHPLAALGMPTMGPGSVSIGGGNDRAADIADRVGSGISRAEAAWTGREDREVAKQSARLQLENMQLQNDRLRSEIGLMSAPGSPPGMAVDPLMPDQAQSVPSIPQEFYKALPTPLGVSGSKPLSTIGVDEDGVPVRVFNQDLGDNDFLQVAHALRYTLPDWWHGHVTRPASRALTRFLRSSSPRRYRSDRRGSR